MQGTWNMSRHISLNFHSLILTGSWPQLVTCFLPDRCQLCLLSATRSIVAFPRLGLAMYSSNPQLSPDLKVPRTVFTARLQHIHWSLNFPTGWEQVAMFNWSRCQSVSWRWLDRDLTFSFAQPHLLVGAGNITRDREGPGILRLMAEQHTLLSMEDVQLSM